MGKSTREKQAKAAEADQKWSSVLLERSKNQPRERSMREQLDEAVGRHFSLAIRSSAAYECRMKSSDVSKNLVDYAKHLFCKYRVPRIFDQAWHVGPIRPTALNTGLVRYPTGGADQAMFRRWFIALGRGESLYKDHTKPFLSKQETHLLLNCPYTYLTLRQATYYAICKAAGAADGVALKICRSKIAAEFFQPNERVRQFWFDCARFFAKQEDLKDYQINHLDDLYDFLDAQRNRVADYSIFGNGYTMKSLMKRMTDWHHEIRRAKQLGNYVWDGHALPDFQYETKIDRREAVWTISQIKNGKELAAEGTAQHHCVAIYRQSCVSGRISIWSLRLNGDRKVTIELGNDGYIRQARGYANRMPRPDEVNVIERWARENGLAVNRF